MTCRRRLRVDPAKSSAKAPGGGGAPARAAGRAGRTRARVVELKLEQYIETFEEEEMRAQLLCTSAAAPAKGVDGGAEGDGDPKMGHRQAIVGAVMGK